MGFQVIVNYISTKTWRICLHACSVFPLFMKFGDPPKEGVGGS